MDARSLDLEIYGNAGRWLFWEGFIGSISFSVLASFLSLSNKDGVMIFPIFLAKFIILLAFVASLVTVVSSYMLLREKHRSLWWLLVLVPAIPIAEIIISLILILFTAPIITPLIVNWAS